MSLPDRNALIDEAIVSSVGIRWLKVARIITDAERALGRRTGVGTDPNVGKEAEDELLSAIAERLQILVSQGRLEGAGNLANWRHSEVRLPSDA